MLLELTGLTALELRDAYRRREASPVEAVDEAAARIEAREPELNAFATLALDEARAQAQAAEQAWNRGEARALEGIPLAVKDLFDTAGLRTTYGSPIFDRHVPEVDAVAVRRAKEAGAIVVGKAATDEFAYGIAGVNPHYGPTRNPWSATRVAGGSSSGSAVSVAAMEVPLALGSDTGGSTRVPAAFCGAVGFKGTWGAVSVDGMWPMGRTLDHAGSIARTPADAALLHGVIAAGRRGGNGGAAQVGAGTRVGVCADLVSPTLDPAVARSIAAALSALESAGCVVVESHFPEAPGLVPTFVTIRDAETLHAHRRAGLFPGRRGDYGALTGARLDAAAAVGLGEYLDAIAARARAAAAFDRLFEAVDVLLLPVSAGPPPAVDGAAPDDEAWELVHPFTVPFNLLRVPACAVRAGFDDDGLPVGVQIVGRAQRDEVVLAVAQMLFDATGPIQRRWPDEAR